jgi:YfiH family protein
MPLSVTEPFYLLGEHFAIDFHGARAVFTTRRGGFSCGPFESLNLGRLTADDPGSVRCNRQTLASHLGVRLGFVRQVHGRTVRELTAESTGLAWDTGLDRLPHADGLFSVRPGLAPTVLTADCLPIAVAGDGAVAMLHGGWRGLTNGIVAEGIEALHEAGVVGPLSAAIGPGAGPCCYEVGAEVHEAFAGYPRDVRSGSKLHLAAIARHQLERAGVEAIHDIGICTICSDPQLLFSHRRDGGVTGRQAGIAWLSGAAVAGGSARGSRG